MKNTTFDHKLKIAGIITALLIFALIALLFYNLRVIPSDLEKKEGVVSHVIEKNGMYNFWLNNDTLTYGKGWYVNDYVISNYIYKQISVFPDIYNQKHSIIQLNDTISFYIKKNVYFEFKLLEKENSFSDLIDNIIIRRISNSEIMQSMILTVNHKQITTSHSDYIFSSQANIILSVIEFLFIILFIIIVFLWTLRVIDRKNIEYENENKRIEEKRQQNVIKLQQDIILLEDQLSAYIKNNYETIPDDRIQCVIELADLYWITKKNTSKSEMLYQKVLAQDPKNVKTLIMYGEFLFSQKRYTEYDDIMGKAFDLDIDSALLVATNYASIKQKKKAKYWKQKYQMTKNSMWIKSTIIAFVLLVGSTQVTHGGLLFPE